MTSRLDQAIASVSATFPLWHAAGDRAGLAAAHESCALFEYYSGRREQAEHHADRAAATAPQRSGPQYGGALRHEGLPGIPEERAGRRRAVLRGRHPDRRGHRRRALALRSAVVRAETGLGLAEPGARRQLVTLIEDAKAHGLDELASSGYSNLSYLDVEQRRLRDAEHVLEESLAFTVARDIPICNHWQTAVRARLRFLDGPVGCRRRGRRRRPGPRRHARWRRCGRT